MLESPSYAPKTNEFQKCPEYAISAAAEKFVNFKSHFSISHIMCENVILWIS